MNSTIVKIAASQLGIKEIDGVENNKTIVQYAKDIGATWINDEDTPWCLTGDIEILTSNGFIRLDKAVSDNNFMLAQLNTKSHEVEFVHSFLPIKKQYNGEIFIITRSGMDLSCDPNHEFYGKWSSAKNYYSKRRIKDMSSNGVGIPTIKSGNKDYNITDRDLMLLGAYISDGFKSFKRLNFGVSKSRKIKALAELSPVTIRNEKIQYKNKQKRTYYSFKCPIKFEFIFSQYKVLKWSFVMSLSARQCRLFIDNYSIYDGTPEQGGSFEIFTQNSELADQLAYMAAMGGYKASRFSVRQVSENTKIEFLHHVYVSQNKYKYISPENIKREQFDGFLYCYQVPSGVIIIRDKSRNIYPVGNCGVFVNWVLKESKYGFSSSARARDFETYGVVTEDPEPGDIVVFFRDGIDSGKGHVAVYTGHNVSRTHVFCIGGNQGNAVSVAKYGVDKIVCFRRASAAVETIELPEMDLIVGAKGENVKKLQYVLKSLNYNPGTIDGAFGEKTRTALVEFQRNQGLPQTGIYDKATKNKMFSILNS